MVIFPAKGLVGLPVELPGSHAPGGRGLACPTSVLTLAPIFL